jgi:CRP-like cAMP-binding protein
MLNSPDTSKQNNRLLGALPAEEYQRLLPSLKVVSMNLHDVLYKPNQIIKFIYFPLSGMISFVIILADGTFVEAGVAGNEGMAGLPVFLSAEKATTQAMCQLEGEAVQMQVGAFRAEIQRNGALASLLQRYTQAHMAMLAQNSACNSQHPLNERCARWLLTVHDRVEGDQFELTQEFLGQMLGVRRAGVGVAMQTMQKAGFISYSRGIITIIDREGLESVTCE